jgi:class 3 adenylate cyclase
VFFAVFSSPAACLAAVVQMQQALAGYSWRGGEQVRVRMGVHTGQASARLPARPSRSTRRTGRRRPQVPSRAIVSVSWPQAQRHATAKAAIDR